MARILLSLLLAATAGCHHQSDTDIQRAAATESYDFMSKSTGISYPIHVYLPPSYGVNSENFPVIYLTDGQWHFALVKGLIVARECRVILVGIELGGPERRRVDYLLPGARKFYDFLAQELLPAIEGQYRVDPRSRTIAGTSFGGAFVGLSLLMDAQSNEGSRRFHGYWSFDGSFTWLNVDDELFGSAAVNQEFQGSVFLTGAGRRGNDKAVEFFKAFVEEKFPRLQVIKTRLNVDHDDVVIPSYTAALEQFCVQR